MMITKQKTEQTLLPQHDRYDHSMIDTRPDYDWPDGKRIAFYVGTNVEYFAYRAGVGSDPSFKEVGAEQTQRNYSWRDYGLRVGAWGMLDLLDEFSIPAAHNTSSLLYRHCPQLMRRIHDRGDEIIGHGRTQSERQAGMWEEDEARMIREVTTSIEAASGERPYGWMGAGMSRTAVTMDLLKEAGYEYVMDWCCDDQPFWLRTRSGPILSVPYSTELNDGMAIMMRHQPTHEFTEMIVDQFEEMLRQCTSAPLVFTFAIHTQVMGQPFRLKLLREALRHICNHPQRDLVWFAHPRAIAGHVASLPEGTLPGKQ